MMELANTGPKYKYYVAIFVQASLAAQNGPASAANYQEGKRGFMQNQKLYQNRQLQLRDKADASCVGGKSHSPGKCVRFRKTRIALALAFSGLEN